MQIKTVNDGFYVTGLFSPKDQKMKSLFQYKMISLWHVCQNLPGFLFRRFESKVHFDLLG